jgi:Na+-driven multidrug efflux pump
MFLTLTRQVLILIPAVLLLSHFFGFEGILYAAPVADVISVALTGTWFYFGIRKLHKMDELLQEPILLEPSYEFEV